MKPNPHPVELLLLGSAVLTVAAAFVVRLLLVPLLALVLVASNWRPPHVPSETVALPAASEERSERPPLPSTVAALRQLARSRGIATAGGRRVSQARKADLLVALA